MKQHIYFLIFILSLLVFSAFNTSAQPFEIKQAVVATGGGTSSSGNGLLKLDSKIGQAVATTDGSMSGLFNLRSGFWTPAQSAPSAAEVSISGRVISNNNLPIKNAFVTIIGGDITEPRVARTNQLGYFTFDNVEVGFFYILTVNHKTYRFEQNTQSFVLFENVSGLVFRSNQ